MVSDGVEAGRLLASGSSDHDDLLQEGGGLSGAGGLHGIIEHGRGGEGVILKVESNNAMVVKLRPMVDSGWRSHCEEGTFTGVFNTFRKLASPKLASQQCSYLILAVSICRQVAGGCQYLLDGGGRPKLEVKLIGRCLRVHQIHLDMFVREERV